MQDTGEIIVYVLLGAAFAAGLFILARWAKQSAASVAAYALAGSSFIYVGFALRSDTPNSWVAVEMTGVALFGSLALLSRFLSPWFVVAGFAAHPLWAIYFHYIGTGSLFTPAAVALGDAGFDAAMAIGVAYVIWSARASKLAAKSAPAAPPPRAAKGERKVERGRAR